MDAAENEALMKQEDKKMKRPNTLPVEYVSKRKVEQKGRFTIIDLAPGSPNLTRSDGSISPRTPRSDVSDPPTSPSCTKQRSSSSSPCGGSPNRLRRSASGSRFKKVERKGRFTIIEHSTGSPSPTRRKYPTMFDDPSSARKTTAWVTAKDTLKTLRLYDAERGKEKGVNVSLEFEDSNEPSEKKAPEVGLNRKHLASRQTCVNLSVEQIQCQQRALELMLQQQQDLQEVLQTTVEQQEELQSLAGAVLPALRPETLEDADDLAENVLMDLFETTENLVTELKAAQNNLSKAEKELVTSREENENLAAVASELRNRCNRLERKLNEEKTLSQALEAERDELKALQLVNQSDRHRE